MPIFDVVLHTNERMFTSDAQWLLASLPPVKERVELGPGLWVGRLESNLAKVLMDTCEPDRLGVPKPVRQFAQFYAFVRELDDNAELDQWDADLRLQRCVALSRFIHPTSVGLRYAARVRHNSLPDSLQIVPAEIHGISPDVFLSPTHKRDWLTGKEAQDLRKLLAVAEPLKAPTFPTRVSRALWYFDYAQRTYYIDLRWTLISTALEALVHTGKGNSTRHFEERVPTLATEVGAGPLTKSEASEAWGFRCRLSHGDAFLSEIKRIPMPEEGGADTHLYDKLEETLRLTILKALHDPAFASEFTDDSRIDARFRRRCAAGKPRSPHL